MSSFNISFSAVYKSGSITGCRDAIDEYKRELSFCESNINIELLLFPEGLFRRAKGLGVGVNMANAISRQYINPVLLRMVYAFIVTRSTASNFRLVKGRSPIYR